VIITWKVEASEARKEDLLMKHVIARRTPTTVGRRPSPSDNKRPGEGRTRRSPWSPAPLEGSTSTRPTTRWTNLTGDARTYGAAEEGCSEVDRQGALVRPGSRAPRRGLRPWLLLMRLVICVDVLLRNVRVGRALLGRRWRTRHRVRAVSHHPCSPRRWLLRQGMHIRIDVLLSAMPAAPWRGTASGFATSPRSPAARPSPFYGAKAAVEPCDRRHGRQGPLVPEWWLLAPAAGGHSSCSRSKSVSACSGCTPASGDRVPMRSPRPSARAPLAVS